MCRGLASRWRMRCVARSEFERREFEGCSIEKLKGVCSRAIKLGDWVRVSRWQEMTDHGIAKG
jgi:hypothetical protein